MTGWGRLFQRVRVRALSEAMKLWLRPKPGSNLVRLGSGYGGWWVPRDLLATNTVAYCAGAGEDVSFDVALARRGCNVTVFDPTPRAIAHVTQVIEDGEKLSFVATGWWDRKEVLRFYVPLDPAHVSHSVVNLQGTTEFFEADVDAVHSLQQALGHERVDLIKMDIEGAEYRVIDDMLRNGPRPAVLCVEFDQPEPISSTLKCVRRLRAAGYTLRKIEHWNYTFTR